MDKITIHTWNVHMHTFAEDNLYVIEELDELKQPDVICLQEYVEGKDASTLKWLKHNDYNITYLPFANYPQDTSISQGIFTAVKKSLKGASSPVILRKDGPRRFRNFPNRRGVIDTVITLEDGSIISIINFHATPPKPYTIDMRKSEFDVLSNYLEELPKDRKVFLCGDFNFFGIDARRNLLKNRFQHFTGTNIHKTWQHNFPFSPLKLNLDYLFWTQNLAVSAKLRPFKISDHRPILASISVPISH